MEIKIFNIIKWVIWYEFNLQAEEGIEMSLSHVTIFETFDSHNMNNNKRRKKKSRWRIHGI